MEDQIKIFKDLVAGKYFDVVFNDLSFADKIKVAFKGYTAPDNAIIVPYLTNEGVLLRLGHSDRPARIKVGGEVLFTSECGGLSYNYGHYMFDKVVEKIDIELKHHLKDEQYR